MSIWTFAEQRRGILYESSLAITNEGRRLASQFNEELGVLLLGYGVSEMTYALALQGADKIYLCEHEMLKEYTTDAYASVMYSLISEENPSLLIFAGTYTGRDLAARVASKLNTGLASECVDVDKDSHGNLVATRSIYNDRVYVEVTFLKSPRIVCVRPEVLDVGKPETGRKAEVIEIKPQIDEDRVRTHVVDVLEADPTTLDIEEADVIIGVGRGLGKAENLPIIAELSAVLGAAVGGSRVAVDEGWLPKQKQIGISGKTAAPRLYIACGISGAQHHMSGIKNAKATIAINRERRATIFQFADLGVVGDVLEIVPLLTEQLREGGAKK